MLEKNLRSTKQEEMFDKNHQLVQEDKCVTIQKGNELCMHLDSFSREASNFREEKEQNRTFNELKQIVQKLQDSIEEKRNTNVALFRSLKLQKKTIAELRSGNMKLRLREV
jgi:hypothetical protein